MAHKRLALRVPQNFRQHVPQQDLVQAQIGAQLLELGVLKAAQFANAEPTELPARGIERGPADAYLAYPSTVAPASAGAICSSLNFA